MESYLFVPETPGCGVYDSKSHGYRYSRDACISETHISCRRLKSLVFFPSLLLFCRAPNKKATKVSYLPMRLKDFLIFCIVLFISYHIIGFCQTISCLKKRNTGIFVILSLFYPNFQMNDELTSDWIGIAVFPAFAAVIFLTSLGQHSPYPLPCGCFGSELLYNSEVAGISMFSFTFLRFICKSCISHINLIKNWWILIVSILSASLLNNTLFLSQTISYCKKEKTGSTKCRPFGKITFI